MSDPTRNDVQDPAGERPSAAGDANDATEVAATHAATHVDAAVTGTTEDTPRPRKRRRRRGRGKSGDRADARGPSSDVGGDSSGDASSESGVGGNASQPPETPAPQLTGAFAALAGGLLSHIDERQVRCSSDGCENTWTWTAAEQIQSIGKPPPKRRCTQCSNVADREVRCMVESCKRTWTWSASAQLKHRSAKRNDGPAHGQPDRRRRRKQEGTPRRRCDLCVQKAGRLGERQGACKVHGCTRTVAIEKELQLRAWAALGTDDLDADAPLAKKMCEVCREFCRTHPDRPVECGRPGCDRSWSYKTGAQLQAFLAGRLEDPMRLACEGADCDLIKAEAAQLAQLGQSHVGSGRNVEIMPCVVIGCEGTWTWRSSMVIPPCNDGDQPVERMCETHRAEHDVAPRPSEEADELQENVDPPTVVASPPDGSVEPIVRKAVKVSEETSDA